MKKGKTVIFLVNLGTPDSPSRKDVYKYLLEFLMDGRVIDVEYWKRWFLVNVIIVPLRSGESSKVYKEVWTPEGSPLLLYTESFTEKLRNAIGNDYHVEFAMRYQNPSMETTLERIRLMKPEKIMVVPMFPQYASATSGSVHEKVMKITSKWLSIPEIVMLRDFYEHEAFIESFVKIGKRFDLEAYDHILFSYHGLPKRQLTKSDPGNHCLQSEDCCQTICANNHFCYSAQCYATTRFLASKFQIPEEKHSVCFQSRLGKDPWTQPYTSDVIKKLANKGMKKVLVFCPAFVTDCLETTIEIGEEYQEEFESYGGEKLDLVPSLNDEDFWVEGFKKMILEKLGDKSLEKV